MSVDTVEGGAMESQVLSSLLGIVVLSSSESRESVEGDDLHWTNKDILDSMMGWILEA